MATRKTSTTGARKSRTPKKKSTTSGRNLASAQIEVKLSHDMVAARAYEIWFAKGCPDGRDAEHWYEAERALLLDRR